MKENEFSRPLDLRDIQIFDDFWGREQELVRREVIPYQWDALNDRVEGAAPSFCMRNFKVAGRMMREKREKKDFVPPKYSFRGFNALPDETKGLEDDKFYGFVFQDSDFAKWIEAVGYSLTVHPDAELEKTADEAIDIVCAAQADNGYLDTYYIINGMDRIFTNLRDHHELYCFGHLTEGAIAYYQATGKDKLLRAAMRYGDFIASYFGREEGKCKGYPGHEIAEMALAKLYEVTGEQKYLELSRFFLDMRGTKPYYFDLEEEERAAYEGRESGVRAGGEQDTYHQAHKPVREQTEAVGHAVRGVYLYSGMADVARLTMDETLYQACERLWNSIVKEKLYITGGIGGTHIGEAFSFPYDLPNDTAYSETCAAIGLVFFARRMLEIKADNRYGDVMEQALYNTVLAGMALDGKSFFYVNPLEVVPEGCKRDERKAHVKPVRQKWFGCACCPPNIARMVGSLGAYIYTQNETTLFTHLYVGSRIQKKVGADVLDMKLDGSFPWEGKVKAALHMDKEITCTLAFRIPGWCKRAYVGVEGVLQGKQEEKDCSERNSLREALCTMQIEGGKIVCGGEKDSGRKVDMALEKGYLYLTAAWQDGDVICLDFPMEVRCVTADYRVRENTGKIAFTRGPVCYCMEEADNGGSLHLCRVDVRRIGEDKEGIRVETSDALGHEMRILKISGRRAEPTVHAEGALYGDYAPCKEKETTLTLIPYYAWSNRGEGEMSVWINCYNNI